MFYYVQLMFIASISVCVETIKLIDGLRENRLCGDIVGDACALGCATDVLTCGGSVRGITGRLCAAACG